MSIEPVYTEADPINAEEAAQERALERRRQRVAEDGRASDVDLTNPWTWLCGAIVLVLTILASSATPL